MTGVQQTLSSATLLILNGPGVGDVPTMAGETITLEDIRSACATLCEGLGLSFEFRKTDDETELNQWALGAAETANALVINPSMGRRMADPSAKSAHDALAEMADLQIPVFQVHLDNVFRHVRDRARVLPGPSGRTSLIGGFGLHSYRLAIRAAHRALEDSIAP